MFDIACCQQTSFPFANSRGDTIIEDNVGIRYSVYGHGDENDIKFKSNHVLSLVDKSGWKYITLHRIYNLFESG